ncbi:MAG: hypothetical protein PWP04_242 [Candidatus Atribacteria bacterium]|nr:hypothetical protein [Candidatus Atribacteria bacterium]
MGKLIIYERPALVEPIMIMGFSGWMDGGSVSSGTVAYLREKFDARLLAEIDPEDYYIFNFPGTMEEVAQFRPYTKMEDGLVTEFVYPKNEFHYAPESNLVFFFGKEPNLRWEDFSEQIMTLCNQIGIKTIFFVGSVSGLTPHTREPRILCSFSDAELKSRFEKFEVGFSDYQGPASIVTLLLNKAWDRELKFISLVVEIPMYVKTTNPKGIRSSLRIMAPFLKVDLDWVDVDDMCDEFERNIDQLVSKYPDLAEQIKVLEENYDKEIVGDDQSFKEWLKRRGIDFL